MKRFLSAVVVVLLLTVPLVAQTIWSSNGVLLNPVANVILADTGALEPGGHHFTVYVASTVVAVAFVEWRDPTDTTTLKSQAMFVNANTNTVFAPEISFNTFNAGDKIRVRLNGTIAGQIQASVFVD